MKGATLITGGAGFIGTNLAHRLLEAGHDVMIFDNLSRRGVEQNLAWIQQKHGARVRPILGDVRDPVALRAAVHDADQVFHFAAQVAVTTSLHDPAHDFAVNAQGTLNVLMALRELRDPPPLVFTSTNKVYGSLDDLPLRKNASRYEPLDARTRARGVDERRRLDFHTPYGCSKGTADQYVLDYARTLGVPAVVFRMSCIYGPHQFGTEDQGWVAHFLIQALRGEPLTLYGDGMQVRDLLFVEDLVDAFLLAQRHMKEISGNAFNIGGGPSNTTSLLELLHEIEQLVGAVPAYTFRPWRPGDQRYYVSDPSRFRAATGWNPKTSVRDGLGALCDWLVGAGVVHAPIPRIGPRAAPDAAITALAGEA